MTVKEEARHGATEKPLKQEDVIRVAEEAAEVAAAAEVSVACRVSAELKGAFTDEPHSTLLHASSQKPRRRANTRRPIALLESAGNRLVVKWLPREERSAFRCSASLLVWRGDDQRNLRPSLWKQNFFFWSSETDK